jgi:hypothetical protein
MKGGLMSIEGIKFCDGCGEMIFSDDVTPIKIEEDGHMQQFHFHNRDEHDCLAHKLDELAAEFAGELLVAAS